MGSGYWSDFTASERERNASLYLGDFSTLDPYFNGDLSLSFSFDVSKNEVLASEACKRHDSIFCSGCNRNYVHALTCIDHCLMVCVVFL